MITLAILITFVLLTVFAIVVALVTMKGSANYDMQTSWKGFSLTQQDYHFTSESH